VNVIACDVRKCNGTFQCRERLEVDFYDVTLKEKQEAARKNVLAFQCRERLEVDFYQCGSTKVRLLDGVSVPRTA
jgi:uncharacterized CHY-type Zn-finger protein